MPVMTKMRDSMPVVFAVLAGIFLLMIIFQWGGQGTIFNPSSEMGVLGTVNGQKITQKEYNKIYANVIAEMKSKNKSENLTEIGEEDAADNAWNEAINESFMNQAVEKMGLTVTDQEVRDVIYSNPSPEIKKQFTDSTGVYHEDWYFKALRDPKNDSLVRNMESEMRDQILKVKWQQAMVATIRVTDSEAYIRYMNDSAKAVLQVVKFMPPNNPQFAASVTDKEIQEYYDSHSWMYKQEEQRKFKFVTFPLAPNNRDTAIAMETANTLKARLAEAPLDNLDTIAKELAEDYSDAPPEPRHIVTMRDLGDDTSLMHAKPGDAAIIHLNGKITAVRVLEVFDTGGTVFHGRHIQFDFPLSGATGLTPQQAKDSTKAVADRLMAQIKAGANFSEAARSRSSDVRTAKKGGDMGWVDLPMYSPYAQPLIVTAAPGDVIGPVETPSGYEIIKIEGRSRQAWLIEGVALSVKPSHQTLLMEEQMANLFRDQAQKVGFDQAVTSYGYHVISEAPAATRKGSPIFNSHLFLDWMFQSAKGDISPPIKIVKQSFILVAQVAEILPAGPQPLAAAKSKIVEAVALKKAVASMEQRAKQFAAQVGTSGDISAPVTAIGDPSLNPSTILMGPAESVQGLPTSEYVVNNWAYSAKPGTISPPLKGEHGYYVAKLLGRTIPSQKDFEAAKPAIVKAVIQDKEQRLMYDWTDRQKEKATIVDYRSPLNGSR